MVTTDNSPFAGDDEKQVGTIESTHYIMEKTSQTSLASATAVPTTSSNAGSANTTPPNEKNGRLSTSSAPEGLPRTSDLSTPLSVHQNPFDTDVEAMITHTTTDSTSKYNNGNNGRRSMGCRGLGDSQVWPGQSHWKKKAKEQKMKRSCTCLSRLSKRNRLICKVLIGLLVIGIAVGVGLGISKPLGAAIWGQHNS
ncbi:hypothetical protein SEUCBS139899_003670 [Sporothrix eucalyptigena]|uniref:Uncharacterized protein n=1 Tax=Sporothrix eucalyptigena TaxID=1812306 RepID=A0ABP0BQA6_9PEZI